MWKIIFKSLNHPKNMLLHLHQEKKFLQKQNPNSFQDNFQLTTHLLKKINPNKPNKFQDKYQQKEECIHNFKDNPLKIFSLT